MKKYGYCPSCCSRWYCRRHAGNRATTLPLPEGTPGQPETPGGNEGGDPGETSLKIGITVGSRTITATMEDNAAARISFRACRWR